MPEPSCLEVVCLVGASICHRKAFFPLTFGDEFYKSSSRIDDSLGGRPMELHSLHRVVDSPTTIRPSDEHWQRESRQQSDRANGRERGTIVRVVESHNTTSDMINVSSMHFQTVNNG